MLEFTNRRIMIIAIILALLSAFLIYQYLNQTTTAVVEETPKILVVVAAQNIPQDVVITADMITTLQIPPEYVQGQAFQCASADCSQLTEDVIGGISKVELYKDEQILKTRVFHGEVTAKFSYRIPENRRALAITMDEVMGVSGLLDVGDHVDILTTMTPSVPGAKPLTFTMMQNVEILSIGTQVITADDGKQHLAGTMTLSVTPDEAQLITFAESNGSLRLTLRNPVDQRTLSLDPFTQDDFDNLVR